MGSRVQEAEDIKNRLDPVKINKIDMMLSGWKTAVEERWANAEAAFNALGTGVVYPAGLLPNVNHMTSKEMLAPIQRSELQALTTTTLEYIRRAQSGMTSYKEMGTTDNQWIKNNPEAAKKRGFSLPPARR
jgi:insecticidal toxin complex protein TccC